MPDSSHDGTLVVSSHIILKDAAYRERVKSQISKLGKLGPVYMIVFGVGGGANLKLLKSKLIPLDLDSLDFFLSPDILIIRYFFIITAIYRVRKVLKKMIRRGEIARIHIENLFAILPLLGRTARNPCTIVLDFPNLVPTGVRSRTSVVFRGISYMVLKLIGRRALVNSHGVVCVSQPFRDRLTEVLSYPGERILVEPNTIEASFRPRPESRNYYRNLFGIDDRLILIHSGSLMPHQCPGAIARLFRGVLDSVPDAYLLLFTLHQKGLKEFLREHGSFRGNVAPMRLDFDDMPQYLAMGDLGVPLRDATEMSRVEPPGKFPEYLACGLPVIISEGVGDASGVVEQRGLGVVMSTDTIRDDIDRIVEFITQYRVNQAEIREKCRRAAQELFVSRDTDSISRVYHSPGGGEGACTTERSSG